MTPGNDQLFRHALSIPAVVRQFLTTWLPAEFLVLVDWQSLQIEKISGINAALAERREDLVYSINVAGSPVCFYILLEHQSTVDRLMPLRVLEYTLLIWQTHRAASQSGSQRSTKLPLVIPIVLYPGPEKWSAVRKLRDLIDIPETLHHWAGTFAPDAGFCIVELGGLPLEKLADGETARAVLAALQSERTGLLAFKRVSEIINEIFSDPQREVAQQVAGHLWQYLIHHSELQSSEIHTIVASSVPPSNQSNFMSTAELLRKEGLEQGLEQGRLTEQRAAVIGALEVRFDSVPVGLLEAIEAITDHDRLRRLFRAAIRCSDVDSFARDL